MTNEDTQYGFETVHSLKTEHKFPTTTPTKIDVINDLTVQLYPTGRAWYMPENGIFQKFHEAINISFIKFILDGELLINQSIPDNEFFDSFSAFLWEYRLGLPTNENIELELRKKAISRKMAYPNNIRARQHILFIQNQLQLAGFNVWVHANEFPYKTPIEAFNLSLNELQHGDDVQHGDSIQHGGDNFDVIANSTSQIENYSPGDDNIWATFFISGEVITDSAEVPLNRLTEFKELVLKLKPAHLAAYTLINYV